MPAALHECKADPKRELEVLETAFARYCEIRAALGEVTPEAYFTHQFIDVDFAADSKTVERWMDLAVDAAD